MNEDEMIAELKLQCQIAREAGAEGTAAVLERGAAYLDRALQNGMEMGYQAAEADAEVTRLRGELEAAQRLVRGYYGEASEGWAKFRAAESRLASASRVMRDTAHDIEMEHGGAAHVGAPFCGLCNLASRLRAEADQGGTGT